MFDLTFFGDIFRSQTSENRFGQRPNDISRQMCVVGGNWEGGGHFLERFGGNIIVSHCSFEGCGFGLDAVTSECISCLDWNLKACSWRLQATRLEIISEQSWAPECFGDLGVPAYVTLDPWERLLLSVSLLSWLQYRTYSATAASHHITYLVSSPSLLQIFWPPFNTFLTAFFTWGDRHESKSFKC